MNALADCWFGFNAECKNHGCDLTACTKPKQYHIASYQRTMCLCVPLRTCVFLQSVLSVIGSASLLLSREKYHEDMLKFNGGYTMQSRVIVDLIQMTGVCWGMMGIIGVIELKTSFIHIYNTYQMVRVAGFLLMYTCDLPLLWNCELFINDLEGAVEKYGWNPVMYKIALGKTCAEERIGFYIFSTFNLMLLLYFTMGTMRFAKELEEEPRYLLNIPSGHISGAYRITSTAKRSGNVPNYSNLSPQEARSLMGPGQQLVGPAVAAPLGPVGPAPMPTFGTMPPGAMPQGTMPPGAMPPGTMPPGTMPPGAMPPGAMPPGFR